MNHSEHAPGRSPSGRGRRWALGIVLAIILLVFAAAAILFAVYRRVPGTPAPIMAQAEALLASRAAGRAGPNAWPAYTALLREFEQAGTSAHQSPAFAQAAGVVWSQREARGLFDEEQQAAEPEAYAQTLQLADHLSGVLREQRFGERMEEIVASGPLLRPLEGSSLLGQTLPELSQARPLARALTGDAAAAAAERDWDRVVSRLNQLTALSIGAAHPEFLINRLVGMAIRELQCEVAMEIVLDHEVPAEACEAMLAAIGQPVSATRLSTALEFERLFILEFVQVMYTDDGAGGGAMAPRGVLARLDAIGDDMPGPVEVTFKALWAPGKREVVEGVNAAFAAAAEEMLKPATERSSARVEAAAGVAWTAPYLNLSTMLPGPESNSRRYDEHVVRTHAARIALAAEAFAARHGRLPRSVEEIDLPGGWPVDTVSGKPLGFRADEAGVVVYSFGIDGVDNQGHESQPRMPLFRVQGGEDWIAFPPWSRRPEAP